MTAETPEALAGGRLTIDRDALAANWRDLAARAEGAATAAVVKGDGYGIGLEPAVRALAAAGCDIFFVAVPEEGLRLRATLPEATIYILDGLFEGAAATYAEANLRPVLSSLPEIEEWTAHRQQNPAAHAALHIDTGMHRMGLGLGEAEALLAGPGLADALGLTLVMSHLACADTPDHPLNQRQRDAFRAVRARLPDVPGSLANSAGIFLGADYRFDLVRPGIALYGGAAVNDAANPMRPVATLEARILQVRDAAPGETVGYGATEALDRPSRLAILAVGYADGYPRHASSSDQRPGARAFLRGRAAPLVGRVSMDLITIDVTGIAGARRGDWVELFGPNIPVDEVAERAGTIGYELLTSLGRRYHRRYSP
ncbi:MAG: alanine racemase [Bauldia litoralis]|uniref:alanine racemase n=1 Tax=Bauldia litoralis TaxID=665467 RepID=UPI0032975021